jgi:hypothetical protein
MLSDRQWKRQLFSPVSGIEKVQLRDKHYVLYVWNLSNKNFWFLKIVEFFVADTDPGSDAFLTRWKNQDPEMEFLNVIFSQGFWA